MRRTGNRFEQIADRDNLRVALHKALRGKRDRREARDFAANLEANLRRIADAFSARTLPVGRFHQFVIHDPKERIITAPCFEERVIHHAIMNVCEPVFERWLIDDTYACRVGRGRIRALSRAEQFAASRPFFLKLDIRKYFDSISQDVLLTRLARLFKERRLLALFERIVRRFRGQAGRGLPIGSLTSQHFANFYLGWFDRFAKERLRVRGYVRHMDDMALWGDSAGELRHVLTSAQTFIVDELGLSFKPWPYINRTECGMDFLGCRVFRRHLTLNRRSRMRFRRKLLALEGEFELGLISERQLQTRCEALVAFTRCGGVSSWQFRRGVLQELEVSGHEARTG